jgi:hypothetical protein
MKMLQLTDQELSLLDGRCRLEIQNEVDRAVARIKAAETYSDVLPAALSGLIADAVSEATENGELRYMKTRTRHCSLCDKSAGYANFQRGARRGKPNYDRPLTFGGIEMADRFVRVQHHITLGGCEDCVARALPFLRESLATIRAQVPTDLAAPGRALWKKRPRRRCTKCEWEGHEGQMGRSRTLMGDGWYPSTCPNCGAENRLASTPVELISGEFEVIDETPASVSSSGTETASDD